MRRRVTRDEIFCGGFRAWSDQELRKRFSTLEARRPGLPRVAFEELANKWQLGRQIVHGSPLACDVQTKEHATCRGWDAFSNADLERFCAQVLGETPRRHGDRAPPKPDAAGAARRLSPAARPSSSPGAPAGIRRAGTRADRRGARGS